MVWLILVAPELFALMFGPQWDAAVLPFQILAGAGLFKVLLLYFSTAVQSQGRIWGEVVRQSAYVVLLVVLAGLGTRWGLAHRNRQ